jgi:hypothetical protein
MLYVGVRCVVGPSPICLIAIPKKKGAIGQLTRNPCATLARENHYKTDDTHTHTHSR